MVVMFVSLFYGDMHCDFIYQFMAHKKTLCNESKIYEVDGPRLKKGNVKFQVFAVFPNPRKGEGWSYVKKAINEFKKEANRCGYFKIILNKSDIDYVLMHRDVIGVIIGLEGAHGIEGKMERVDSLFDMGLRVFTISWNTANTFADGTDEIVYHGLSKRGKELIRKLESRGIIIDVSHLPEEAFYDVMNIVKNPVIASHSGVKSICNHKRNLTDEQIRRIAENGGVIGIPFHSPFIKDKGEATMDDVVKHIVYVRNLVGYEYVGFGSDFDGLIKPVKGLEDATKYPLLEEGLRKENLSEDEIRAIAVGNFLRVLYKVLPER